MEETEHETEKGMSAAGMIIASLLAGCGNQGTDTQPVKKTAEESAQRGEGQETLKPT